MSNKEGRARYRDVLSQAPPSLSRQNAKGFEMGRVGEEIVTAQFLEAITSFSEQAQVASKGSRVTGNIDEVRDVQADDLFQPLGADSRPRRVQDEKVKAGQRFLLEHRFHAPFEEAAVPDAGARGVLPRRGGIRALGVG